MWNFLLFHIFFHLVFSLSFLRPPVCHKTTEIASHPKRKKADEKLWTENQNRDLLKRLKYYIDNTQGIVFRVDSFITALSRCNDGRGRRGPSMNEIIVVLFEIYFSFIPSFSLCFFFRLSYVYPQSVCL